ISSTHSHLSRQSILRLPAYDALFTSTNNELAMLRISRSDVEKWLERMITL
ncbi:hypothetical protein H4582DRAFT_1818675, partial [Lactarius indigo]